MFDLSGKRVVFFGGAGYLASPIIQDIAALGANLFIADMNEERASLVAQELSEKYPERKFKGALLNTLATDSIQMCFDDIKQFFGKIDVMVSGISYANNKTVEEITPEEMNTSFAAHVTGSFLLTRGSAELMPNGGSIVLFSSMYGQVAPDPSVYHHPMKSNPIDYGMSKAAINQMTRYLAAYYGPKGIRVNAVSPGPFPNVHKYPAGSEDFFDRLAAKTTLKRVGRQSEMSGAVVYLASDESSFTNGHILNVDGGWTAW